LKSYLIVGGAIFEDSLSNWVRISAYLSRISLLADAFDSKLVLSTNKSVLNLLV
jgi:hypothetical protein